MPRRRQCGFTLIELVMSIIIIGVAVTGVMMVMTQTVLRSADPMLVEQATAIAEAYMEEIMVKEYDDPDGLPNVVEATRDLYDAVDDYNLAAHTPSDQLGGATPAALSAYSVTVTVGAAAAVASDAGTTQPMKRITVTVSHPSGVSYTLEGYRALW